MDGRTIQEASQRALDVGATPAAIVADAGAARRRRPARRHDLLQPGSRTRATSGSRRRSPTPASTPRSSPTSRSTSSTAGATPPTPPASRRSCSPRRPRPTSGCARSARGRAASSTASSLLGVTGERDAARRPGARDGPALQGRHRQAGAARRRDLDAGPGGRGGRGGRRRRRRERARRADPAAAVGPTAPRPSWPSSARLSTERTRT